MRDAIVREALSVSGLCACAPWRSQLAELLGPPAGAWGWDLARPFRARRVDGRWATQGVSTCALVASGVLYRAGVALPYYERPYVAGSAMSREIALARSRDQWVSGEALRWITPDPGDVVVVGAGIGTHMLVAVGWEGPGDAPELVSVDGGQVCLEHGNGHEGRGLQAVLRRVRPWRWTTAGLPRLKDRLVQGWWRAAG